jgi:hypothetical protein
MLRKTVTCGEGGGDNRSLEKITQLKASCNIYTWLMIVFCNRQQVACVKATKGLRRHVITLHQVNSTALIRREFLSVFTRNVSAICVTKLHDFLLWPWSTQVVGERLSACHLGLFRAGEVNHGTGPDPSTHHRLELAQSLRHDSPLLCEQAKCSSHTVLTHLSGSLR